MRVVMFRERDIRPSVQVAQKVVKNFTDMHDVMGATAL
jgi:hypothetical protein